MQNQVGEFWRFGQRGEDTGLTIQRESNRHVLRVAGTKPRSGGTIDSNCPIHHPICHRMIVHRKRCILFEDLPAEPHEDSDSLSIDLDFSPRARSRARVDQVFCSVSKGPESPAVMRRSAPMNRQVRIAASWRSDREAPRQNAGIIRCLCGRSLEKHGGHDS
jgi:hypothetical protein